VTIDHKYNVLFRVFLDIQDLATDTTSLTDFLETQNVYTAQALLDHINKLAHEVSTAILIVTACDEE